MDKALADPPDGQLSPTDPDARAMATSARNGRMVGYTVQTAMGPESHLIVTHEGPNQLHDRDLVATAAKGVLARHDLHVLADTGYFSSREILTCFDAGIITTVHLPETSGSRGKGDYVMADFACEPDGDVYGCPAGESLSRYTAEEEGLQLKRRWTGECDSCPIRPRRTAGKERRITRWKHQHLTEEAQIRLQRASREQFYRLLSDNAIAGSTSPAGMSGTILQWKASSRRRKLTGLSARCMRTRDEARADGFGSIERFYNLRRRHSKQGYLRPMAFEARTMLA